MPLDTNIPLGVRAPEIANPLDQFAKVASIRNLIQQGKLGTENLHAAQTENQQRDLELQDNQTLRQLAGESNGDIEELARRAAGKVSPKTLASLQASALDHKTKMAVLTKDQLANLREQNKMIADEADQITQAPLNEQPALYAAATARLQQKGLVQPGELPAQYPGQPAIERFRDIHAGMDSVFERHLKAKGEERAVAKEGREVAEAAPKLAEAQVKADVATRQNAATQLATATSAEQYGQMLDALPHGVASKFPPAAQFDPKKTPQMVRQLGMTPDQQATTAGQDAARAETAAQHVLTNKHEEARIGLERARNVREQAIYQQTYGEGANEALKTVEPKLRVQATSAAQKAATEFQTAQRASDAIESMISMVRSGNKAAGSNLPIVGAETLQALNGIKRINRTEIEQYQGAGSLLDKISGRVGKIVAGQPIPADILNDIEEMHKVLRSDSEKQYREKLDSVNQNYHSAFKPAIPERKAPAGDLSGISTDELLKRLTSGGK